MSRCRDVAVLLGILLPRLPCLHRADIVLRHPTCYLRSESSNLFRLTLRDRLRALDGELSPFIRGCQQL